MKVQKAIRQWKACYEVWSCITQIKQHVTGGKWWGGKRSRTPAVEANVLLYRLNEGQHMAQVVLLLWCAEVLYSLVPFFFFFQNKLQNQKVNEHLYIFNIEEICWTGVQVKLKSYNSCLWLQSNLLNSSNSMCHMNCG